MKSILRGGGKKSPNFAAFQYINFEQNGGGGGGSKDSKIQ